MNHPNVKQFFEALDLDVSEAEVLFDLLDASGDGMVAADEFLAGCLRLRGHAKALDLLVLSREVSQFGESNQRAIQLARQATEQSREEILRNRALSQHIQTDAE